MHLVQIVFKLKRKLSDVSIVSFFLHLLYREHIKLIEDLFVIDSSGCIPIQTAADLFNDKAVKRNISTLHETTFGTLVKSVFSGQVARKLRKLSKDVSNRACKYL